MRGVQEKIKALDLLPSSSVVRKMVACGCGYSPGAPLSCWSGATEEDDFPYARWPLKFQGVAGSGGVRRRQRDGASSSRAVVCSGWAPQGARPQHAGRGGTRFACAGAESPCAGAGSVFCRTNRAYPLLPSPAQVAGRTHGREAEHSAWKRASASACLARLLLQHPRRRPLPSSPLLLHPRSRPVFTAAVLQ